MSFEQQIQEGIFAKDEEKTFIDKLLARKDIEKLRKIIRKPRLNREDMLEVLYLSSSSEIKLVNLGEWDRYIILKFFVWIREFAMTAEMLYDYEEYLKGKPSFNISKNLQEYIDTNLRMMEHNIKFLIDLYFNIVRSSLSIEGMGFMELLKNKFEMDYKNDISGMTQVQNEKKGLFRR